MSRGARTSAGPVSAESTDVFVGLHTVHQRLRHTPVPVDEAAAESLRGLKPRPRQVTALFALASDQPMSVSELAARMQIGLATASQLVSELADLGLVTRIEDPADRRRTLIEINDEHRELTEAVLNLRLRPLDAALRRLTAEERAGLSAGLRRLAAELEFMCQESSESTCQLHEVSP